jgi:hypothetical protein
MNVSKSAAVLAVLIGASCTELRDTVPAASDASAIDAELGIDASDSGQAADSADSDARPDAARDATVAAKRVFVTSARFTGAMAPSSATTAAAIVAAIDAKCESAAVAANLGGNWKAWISATDGTTAIDAIDHVGRRGPFVRVDGRVAFIRLYDTSSIAPLSDRLLTENGQALTEGDYELARTWSGTTLSGSITNSTCTLNGRSWRTSSASALGTSGAPLDQSITGEWSITGASECNKERRLYCFEN